MDRRVERVHCTKSKIAELPFGAFLVHSVSWAGSHEGTEQGPSRKKALQSLAGLSWTLLQVASLGRRQLPACQTNHLGLYALTWSRCLCFEWLMTGATAVERPVVRPTVLVLSGSLRESAGFGRSMATVLCKHGRILVPTAAMT